MDCSIFVFLAIILNIYASVFSKKFWDETFVHFENCSTIIPSGYSDIQPQLVSYNFSETFETIELNLNTGARCLDGSPYKFKLKIGDSNKTKKWMIYFQGSSFCGGDGEEVLQSCYERTLTASGTSNSSYWGENGTFEATSTPMGWFSSMEEYNPLFANYNKVLLISCDGSNFLSSIEEPLYYNGTALYFRGMNNTLSTFEHLKETYNLFGAEEIVIAGASSGGTSAWIWTPYLQDYFPDNIKLWLLSDAGLFVDAYNENNQCYLYRFFMQQLTTALRMGSQPAYSLFRRCKHSHSNETLWKCLIPEYFFEDIFLPAFIINSQNDFKQTAFVGGIGCIAQEGSLTTCSEEDRVKITKVREKFLNVVMKMKIMKPNWGFWLRTCFEHTYHYTWAWYGHEMDVFSAELQRAGNARDALYEWYFNMNQTSMKAPSYIDLIDWLHNPLCKYGENQYDQSGETPIPNGYIISNVFYHKDY